MNGVEIGLYLSSEGCCATFANNFFVLFMQERTWQRWIQFTVLIPHWDLFHSSACLQNKTVFSISNEAIGIAISDHLVCCKHRSLPTNPTIHSKLRNIEARK